MKTEGRYSTLVILGELPSLNKYTQANRNNRYGGGRMKTTFTNLVASEVQFQGLPVITKRTAFFFHWYMKNKRQDPDNFVFAKKFILDGLVKTGILPNDGWSYVGSFSDNWEIDRTTPRVVVQMMSLDIE